MYKKRTKTIDIYKLVKQPSKSYCNEETLRIVKEEFPRTQEIFEVEGSQGLAKIIIENGIVILAYCATWNSLRIKNKVKVLNKFMQISQRGFIEVYNSLNKKSSWYDVAKQILERKKQKLLSKETLTKTEKELLKL